MVSVATCPILRRCVPDRGSERGQAVAGRRCRRGQGLTVNAPAKCLIAWCDIWTGALSGIAWSGHGCGLGVRTPLDQ
jgi:hypothetical protein